MKNKLIIALSAIAISAAAPAMAATRAGAVTWTPSLDWVWYGKDLNLDNGIVAGMALGYNFTRSLSAEAAVGFGNGETSDDTGDADVRHYSVNGYYHFENVGGWEPYVTLGAGNAKTNYPAAADETEATASLGGGLNYFLTDDASLRLGVKDVRGLDSDTDNVVAGLGVVAQFGAKPAAPVAAPAPVAAVVEAPKDSDKDGVTDDKDQCPNTPAEAKVDEKGCNVMLKETVSMELNIEFETAKDVVREQYQPEVEKLAKFLKQYPDTVVVVEGHTDDRGSDVYNKKLSQRRADSVQGQLVTRYGIDAARVKAQGFGESKPIADNKTEVGRQKNRRVVGVVSATVEKIEKR